MMLLLYLGTVNGLDVVVGAQDFRFIGGSFAASGEAFIAGVQCAIEKVPFIFSCSGGQRMMVPISFGAMSRTT